MKSIKLSDYFKIIRPNYIYIKITPHKSIRNYNSSNIAKAIANTYRALYKRIHREQKKIFFETNFKISYVIDIKNENVGFYFIVPQIFKNIIVEKIKEIWAKATVEEVEPIDSFSKDASIYEISYKKEDALSLQVDKKSNEPLNSILGVMDIMKDDDRVTIVYNFSPISQFGWLERYTKTMDKIKEKRNIDKDKDTALYYFKAIAGGSLYLLDCIMEVLGDFCGAKRDNKKESIYMAIMGVLEQQKSLSAATKRKKEQMVIDTQLAILSESKEEVRKENNAHSICQAFRVIDEDNELKYKKLKASKREFNIESYSIGTKYNTLSTDEISNFIQIPGRALLAQHRINHIKTEENQVPLKLRKGTKRLGMVTFKGEKQESFLEDEYNIGNLPLVLVGGQGSGKSTLISNYSLDSIAANEGIIVLDFIKNCELSNTIKKITPTNRLIEIDLSKESDLQGLGYNEIEVKEDMSNYDKLTLANLQAQQVMALIDSISIGDPLSSRMRRFLSAAANVVFVQGKSRIRDVVDCLQDYKKRERYINNLNEELMIQLEDEVGYLKELDEWSKATKNEQSKKIGTVDSKIEHILDRIAMLREDFKLKYMYKKDIKNNINLVECMEENKVVLIKMKESEFPTKMIKNILVTYFMSKIWLSTQVRGGLTEKPSRCNVLVDEIFQAPTSMQTLKYILPQSRKFGTKFVFSTQYLDQLNEIFDTLEASGASFMLLRGCTERDFSHFKGKLDEFEYEDLRDMEKWSSLNIIYYSDGYSTFISKLPSPLDKCG